MAGLYLYTAAGTVVKNTIGTQQHALWLKTGSAGTAFTMAGHYLYTAADTVVEDTSGTQ